ncbi:MAG: hypothetical protein HQK99_09915 [Nitrospirae bacterium]|nr:hypothetical protein [Nitrospirota bacterium]
MMKDNGISRHSRMTAGIMICLSALLIIAFVPPSSAANLVMIGYIDGYLVTMTVVADTLPAVGTNKVLFELNDSSNREVTGITDIGATYGVSGTMPRINLPLYRIPGGYAGTLNINKAALHDVFFVFERRGEKQRVVRFSFQTKDNTQGVPQNR